MRGRLALWWWRLRKQPVAPPLTNGRRLRRKHVEMTPEDYRAVQERYRAFMAQRG
jgi:hypothetical protein